MKNTILKYSILVFLVILIATSCKKDDGIPSNYDDLLVEEVNNYRVSIGLSALENNEVLWYYAHEHSTYMAGNETNANHDGITERYEAIRDTLGNGEVTENVIRGEAGDAWEVVQTWLKSISHKANIKGNYTLTAISAVKSDNGSWYYTQIFFKP